MESSFSLFFIWFDHQHFFSFFFENGCQVGSSVSFLPAENNPLAMIFGLERYNIIPQNLYQH
jgi:hypothetical protein